MNYEKNKEEEEEEEEETTDENDIEELIRQIRFKGIYTYNS
jgi:hypothetical protein